MKNTNRLIIADPSFEDWVGHHAPYDISVLKAGDQNGLAVAIWAAKILDADVSASAAEVSKIYTCSAWGRPFAVRRPLDNRMMTLHRFMRPFSEITWLAARLSRSLLGQVIPPILKRLALRPKLFISDFLPPALLEMQAMLVQRIETSTARIKKSLPATIKFVYRRLTPPFFKRLITHPRLWLTDLAPPFLTKLAQVAKTKTLEVFPQISYIPLLGKSRSQYYETVRSITHNKLGSGDVVFCHMITGFNFLAWALIARYCERKGIRAKILFRYPVTFFQPQRADIKMGRRIYESCVRSGLVEYYTDSQILSEAYREFLNAPVQTLPIPHLPAYDPVASLTPSATIVVAVLGNARAEKGFCDIIESLKLLQAAGEQGLEFHIQINNPDEEAALSIPEIDEIDCIKITTYQKALTEKEYEAILFSCDVVLAPYHSEVYGARTSGVLLEAISTAKIAIVVEGTWLSTELEQNGAGVIVKNKSPSCIASALTYVRDHFQQLQTEASVKAGEYRRKHGADNFLNSLIGAYKFQPSKVIRALIVFPFSDFFEQSTGATVRTGLLCQYLIAEGVEVSVVLPMQNRQQPHPRLSGVQFYQYHEKPIRSSNWKSLLTKNPQQGDSYRTIWYTTRSRSNAQNIDFDRALNRALQPDSVVLIDYPFDVSNVKYMTRAYGNKLCLTLHDLMGLLGEEGPLRSKALDIELKAAKLCDRVVTVAKHESDFLKSVGVDNDLIPNPCVISHEDLHNPAVKPMQLKIEGSFVLFVGSNHLPNIDAAMKLKSVAKQLVDSGSHVKVVVAGSCLEAENSGSFISLGRVDDDTLQYLNANCMMFVCPLAGGTGASLKTIQAMGFEKIVLGTQDAFRGLDTTSLVNCIIEDRLDEYAQWISEIERDSGRFDSIGACALEFARGYDYRAVFQPQLEYIKHCASSDGLALRR